VRPLRATDFPALYAVASDPLIWAQHPVPDRHREDVFREFFADHLASGGAVLVLDRGTGDVIGTSRFHGYDPARDEVEIGWTFLARSRWGGTYNRELKSLMLAHAFRFVRTVVFLVGPENVRSQRSLEKIGAARIADRVGSDGQVNVAYAIERSQWSSRGATNPEPTARSQAAPGARPPRPAGR
jgi:RimJ/RimL family protein N-acetyltransferase